eukprot:3932978-Rhodomonas_salina.1
MPVRLRRARLGGDAWLSLSLTHERRGCDATDSPGSASIMRAKRERERERPDTDTDSVASLSWKDGDGSVRDARHAHHPDTH